MTPTEIRHFHLFCGLGGGAKGFNAASPRVGNLQANFRCIGGIDVDAAAVRDFERLAGVRGSCIDLFDRDQYRAFHGAEPPTDWRESTIADIHRAAGNERPHIVFLSAPCLPASGQVITETGPRAISKINVGDRVLTHRGRMREVTHVGSERYAGIMYGIRLGGTVDRQDFTAEHPLWVRRVVRRMANDLRRELGEPAFIAAKDVRVGDRIGFPVEPAITGTARAFVESLGDPQIAIRGGKSTGRYAKPKHEATLGQVTNLTGFRTSADLWFLLGCYLGDGYRRKDGNYTVSFCVGAFGGPLADRIRSTLDSLGITWHTDTSGGSSNVRIRATGKHLHMLCGVFGDGAAEKRIPPSLMNLEDELLDALIDGYRATDGSAQPRRTPKNSNELQARWKIASVSLQLLRDVQRLLLRRGTFASVHKCWPGGEQVIEGRTVQTRPRWELNVRLDPKKRTIHEFIDGAVWVRVREIERWDTVERVWNLSVDEDDTYCAPMIATHNCKGFSGLLSENLSRSTKYQALNRLTLRGVWLMLEAWADDPPELVLFENVPRIAQRGRHLLDQIGALLARYGYAVNETTHDCGAIGALAQSRKRFLLVARHQAKVPAFLYQPETHALRSVGTVLGRMLMPSDGRAGPMHRLPALHWKTWVRLAFVEAGADWRSLNKLAVEDGFLRDFAIEPCYGGAYGVQAWGQASITVTGRGSPTCGAFSIADPRIAQTAEYSQLGVRDWDAPTGAISGQSTVGGGKYAVADPRIAGAPRFNSSFRVVRWADASPAVAGPGGAGGGLAVSDPRVGYSPNSHRNKLAVVDWESRSRTVTGATQVQGGALSVADPRSSAGFAGAGKYIVTSFAGAANTVIAGSTTGNGAFAVADPRLGGKRAESADYRTAAPYGVLPWTEPAGAISANGQHDNGRWSVADPRLPEPNDRLTCVIRALDGTWHRPFTTLELAALQSLVDPEDMLELDGLSDSAWRERIGNAVPPAAAQAIAEVMGTTLLLAWSGETFTLSAQPIWVRPIALAIVAPGAGT